MMHQHQQFVLSSLLQIEPLYKVCTLAHGANICCHTSCLLRLGRGIVSVFLIAQQIYPSELSEYST